MDTPTDVESLRIAAITQDDPELRIPGSWEVGRVSDWPIGLDYRFSTSMRIAARGEAVNVL